MRALSVEHDESQIDKATFDLLWDNLAAKLNYIGPPDHTTSEWRRIWSVHKYKNKRKRLEDSDSLETECNVRLGIPLLFSKLLFNDLSLID